MHNLLTNSLDAFDALPAKGSPPAHRVTTEVRGADVLMVSMIRDRIAANLTDRLSSLFVPQISGMGLGLP